MINFPNPLLYSIKFTSSYKGTSIFFLIFLSGSFAIVFGGLDHIYVQGSVDCDRQTFSPVDCPTSSGEEETNNDDDRGNIEEQIPSVIPFP